MNNSIEDGRPSPTKFKNSDFDHSSLDVQAKTSDLRA